MKSIALSALMLMVFLLLCCSGAGKTGMSSTGDMEVYFGNTGGFTNLNPVYQVNSKKEILRKENEHATFVLVKKIKRKEWNQLVDQISNIEFNHLKINKISNMSHFIEVKTASWQNRVIWSENSDIPNGLIQLDQKLYDLVKK